MLGKGNDLWTFDVNNTRDLMEMEIRSRLMGPKGAKLNITVKRTLKAIERYVHGDRWRHRFNEENGDDARVLDIEYDHNDGDRRGELLEAGAITQEQYEYASLHLSWSYC
eukprot:525212-Hanusia_phi.AAC.3